MDWTALSVSLKLAAVTALIVLPLGLVIARWLATTDHKAKPLVEALVLLPLVLPPTVLGYYLLIGLAPDSLFARTVGRLIGGEILFTFPAIVIASLIVNLPFAVTPLQRAFEAIPRNVREAAWVSGLSRAETFKKIELQLAWPGIVSALALVIAHTLGEFGVLLLVGGSIPGETLTLSIAIYDRIQAFRNAEAAVMSGALLLLSLVVLAIVQWTAKRQAPRRERP
jgi:molybdate transport system permease protein